jgi:hypothetical protein
LSNDRGSFRQSGPLCGTPTAFTSDQLKTIPNWADYDRLNDSTGFDRTSEFIEGLFPKSRSWLIRTWFDQVNIDFLWSVMSWLASGSSGSTTDCSYRC